MDEKESTRELVVVDVTHYKKVKKALHESEERYRQLFENVPIGIYRTTPDGRIVDSNPALVKMLGYSSLAGLAKRNLEKDFSDVGYKRADFIKALKRHGMLTGLESVWKKKDGTPIHVRENAKLVRAENGEVFYEGTVEDITLEKQSAAAQRLRLQQLEIINAIIALGNSSDSLNELLDSILDHVLKPLAFNMAGIFLYDPDAGKMKVMAYRGVSRSFFANEKYMSTENMPFSQVLQQGLPVFVENTRKIIPDLARKLKWKMAASIPLLSRGRAIGALNVASCRRGAFTPEEKDVLVLIGKETGTLVSKLQAEAALRESEKYYRTLIDTSPDIIAVTDLEGNLRMVNRRFVSVSGRYLDEIIGKNSFDFVAETDHARFQKSIKEFVKTGKLQTIEYGFKKKNNEIVPLELSASLQFDPRGKPSGMIGYGRDISERKRIEETLRQSETKYRELVENHNDVIFWVDASGRIEYISPAIFRITGYTAEEVTGKNLFDFFSPEDRQKYGEQMRQTQDAGNSVGEYLIAVKDKSSKWIRASSRNIVENGEVVGVRGIMSDISESKRAEAQLRFMGSITENISDAIMVTDTDFAITYVNKVSEKLFGYTLDELKGKKPGMLNAEPEAERIQEELYKAVASGKPFLGESLNRRKDGSTFYCEYKVMPLEDSDGKIYAYTAVQRDISERKRNEAVLRQSEETFRRTFEAIPDPAYICERQGDGGIILRKFNQAAARATRNGAEKFLDKGIEPFFAAYPDFKKHIELALAEGRSQIQEMEYTYRSTGERRWLIIDYIKTSANGILMITKDISERKEAERKLLAYQKQLQALTSEMMLVEERERRRIASELHDHIGQNLALCKLKLTALEQKLNDDGLQGELAQVRLLLENSIQDARSLIFDLSPPVLYELGLAAALEWLAERMQGQFGIPVEFEARLHDPQLKNDQQVVLFRVARELLLNVGKHSHASRAKIILSPDGPFLKLQVNDDGAGFDAAQAFTPREPDGGFGLFSMRERLNYLGGRLEVKSKRGQGSQITVWVPLPGAKEGGA